MYLHRFMPPFKFAGNFALELCKGERANADVFPVRVERSDDQKYLCVRTKKCDVSLLSSSVKAKPIVCLFRIIYRYISFLMFS